MATNVFVVALSSYSRGFHFAINCWPSIVMCYLVPGPMPCPEVVAISYIRQAEVLTLSSVEGDAQVEQKNHTNWFLTSTHEVQRRLAADPSSYHTDCAFCLFGSRSFAQ